MLTSNTNGDNVSVRTNDGTGAPGTASNYYVGGGLPSSRATTTGRARFPALWSLLLTASYSVWLPRRKAGG
ncbi:hypothetical protein ACIQPT_01415 [Streptomyces sp. NPDC091289]|uniref:hypothetical protein n=1 Tax=Streptomyces sp. NPDC091289 TaxID=3365989 RepID=UPI0038102039